MADDRRARFEHECVVHLDAVFRAALRLTRDPDSARDLVQDAMLRAYRAFDTYTAGTNARAWLFSIVYSVFINGYHRARRQPPTQSIEELEARLGSPWPAAAPMEVDTQTIAEPEVQVALDALPDEFRAAVLLVDVEELTYDEAATALGCPVGTVRSRLFRARRLLGAALADYARRLGLTPEGRER